MRGIFLAALALAGCAGAKPAPDARVHRLPVPLYSDASHQCGPAALASVLSFWGAPVAPVELKTELFLVKMQGTLPMDLAPAARARGFDATPFSGNVAGLKASLKEGRPLIAYWNVGTRQLPVGHYVVVTGYDDTAFYVHSGGKADKRIPFSEFSYFWDKTDRWTLLVLPKSR